MAQGQISAEEVFPAYAGMSRSACPSVSRRSRFPRLRGDEPTNEDVANAINAFSPPTRG